MNRPMRRQDRAVTDPETINAVIDACPHCSLALCDHSRPYVVPLDFGHTVADGRHIFYFHGASEGRKIDLIRETGWACVQMSEGHRIRGEGPVACTYTSDWRSVIAEGPIEEVTDLEEKRAALLALMTHITGRTDWTFPEAALQKVCVTRLTAENLTCKEHA